MSSTSPLANAKSPSIDPACSWRDMTAEQIQSAKSYQIFWGILSSLMFFGGTICPFAGTYIYKDSLFPFSMVTPVSSIVGWVALSIAVKDQEFEYHPYSYPTKLDVYGDPYSYYYQNHSKYTGDTPESRLNMVRLFKTKNWTTINYILNRDNFQEHLLNLGPLVRNKMITIEWAEKLKELGERYKKECKLDKNKSLGEPAWKSICSISARTEEKALYEKWVADHGEPECPRKVLDKKFQAEWRTLQTSLIFDSTDTIKILPPLLDIVRAFALD